jgi:two-component system NtrC family sensor kinase
MDALVPEAQDIVAELERKLNERTVERDELLERQIATDRILKVIASSPSDVQPVFDAIAASANRLVGGFSATVMRFIGDGLHLVASTPTNQAADETLKASFPRPLAEFPPFELVRGGETVQFADTEAVDVPPVNRQLARLRGYRSMLFTPLMSNSTAIGILSVTRVQPGEFAKHHVQLLKTFADQAVIAIENTRLFNETQEALELQKASGEILSVISNSVADTQPVFDKILRSIERLFGGESRFIFLVGDDGLLHIGAVHGPNADRSRLLFPVPIKGTASEVAIRERRLVAYADVMNDSNVPAFLRESAHRLGENYSTAVAPMLWEDSAIGSILVGRTPPKPFTDKELATLRTFADQAVIAIQNARMFKEVQARTKELAASLEDLRTAQDRLVQTEKLASLGQLTAGIAHEIKNPLNFVNNFSALSAELTDELNDVLKPVAMDGKIRGEVDELTGLLKDNLEKVVQHGKRADSIVKNMLLHSREGSGEHRAADINTLLDESLNLAYHGARAEKGEFNITLQRDFDADAGTIELFPQEITRAFLNLISNGVYAATRRKTDDQDPGFEPILRATTKNLGSTVEICIRDNGAGIPADVQEKMFNPFFTTKPAGEGTGLGLSMTHDIVVKQHGGRIDVTTEPRQFTEITIVLPRKSNLSGSGSR